MDRISLVFVAFLLSFGNVALAQTFGGVSNGQSAPLGQNQSPDAAGQTDPQGLRITQPNDPLFAQQQNQSIQYVDPSLRLNPTVSQPANTRYAPPIADAQEFESGIETVRVFGDSLFQGQFAAESFRGFNPDYLISVGDQIDVRLWGAIDGELRLLVDAKGNLFIPRVGPVRVANIRNGQLNSVVLSAVRKVYRRDVGVYATLAAAVPVKVFVSGFVRRPGLYPGFASDSLLHFIDRAGGIDSKSGSYIDVRVLRGEQELARVNLYDFLVNGKLKQLQLRDGDSIFISPIRSTAMVAGLVATPSQFEFKPGTSLQTLIDMSGASGRATNVRVTRREGPKQTVIYVPVGSPALDGAAVTGDEIEVIADRLIDQITVTLEGEHAGSGQFVLPYSATLADLIEQINYSEQSNSAGMQLFRNSVAERQRQVLGDLLDKLEQSVLAARSTTKDEAELRTREAELVMRFVERARKVEPRGQVVLAKGYDPANIALEDGDVIRIPRASQLVQVHGEVFLPNAFVWRKGYHVDDYIRLAGGLIQKSTGERIIVLKPSGEISNEEGYGFILSSTVQPGDEILVLPGVDTKRFQFGKDVVQVMYQIAIAAGVLTRL